MTQQVFQEKLETYLEEMPSLPTTVSKVLDVCNQQNPSPSDLNRVIALDPVLLSKILRLINSAYYGLSSEITSLVRAIIMLGINTVKNLALSTAVIERFNSSDHFKALDSFGYWRHSLGVAVISRKLAQLQEVDPKQTESFFIAGLLHDLGKIPINEIVPEMVIQAINQADHNKTPLYQAEGSILGEDHTSVGLKIVQQWKLGKEISEVIEYHHHPENYRGKHKTLVYTVTDANYFAGISEIGFSGSRYTPPPPRLSDGFPGNFQSRLL